PANSLDKVETVEIKIPSEYKLEQNYPNPFNPTTNIKYQIPEDKHVSLKIYNIIGQLVKVLVDDNQATGSYSIQWDGRDNHGAAISSGVYLYRIEAGDFVTNKKMIYMK
ncbi:MAG: T9SS type A sorting domain-containing protein, partial [Ignavibacteriaceae bacterium]